MLSVALLLIQHIQRSETVSSTPRAFRGKQRAILKKPNRRCKNGYRAPRPQLAILSYLAIGCFATHCGWNSLLESIAHGVLVMTWSYFANQFLHERLAVDVLGVGVLIGVTMPVMILDDEAMSVLDNEAMIVQAVLVLMDGGEEAEERRRKAKEYGEKAHGAMEKGGSSYENLIKLIKSFKDGGGKGHWNSVV